MIAFKEMVRAKVRFGLLIGAIGLLVFLILFQQALRDGLITSFVGAIEHQDAPVLVYSTDARRNLQSSTITPELEAQVRAVDGVQDVGRIGQGTYSVTAGGAIKAAAIIGYEKRSLGAPESLTAGRYPTADGEGIANETDASEGFDLGDVVRVEPGGYRIRIVGQSRDTNLQATPTIFARYGTWEAAVQAANPDAQPPLPNALGVAPVPGVTPDEVVQRIDAVSNDLEALDACRRGHEGTRGRAGEPLVPRDLPALWAGGAARHRPLLPDRHPAEGAHAHVAACGRRALVDPRTRRCSPRSSWWWVSAWPSARCSSCRCRSSASDRSRSASTRRR